MRSRRLAAWRFASALELGVGTGETAKRVLAVHPGARLVGIDGSEEMLSAAKAHSPWNAQT